MNFTIILLPLVDFYSLIKMFMYSLKLKDVKVIIERTGLIYTKKNICFSGAEVLGIVDYKVKF